MKNLSFKKIILFFASSLFFSFLQTNALAKENFREGGFYIIESLVDENKAIDINSASTLETANVQIWEKNYSFAQIFYVKEEIDGFCELKAVCSGMVLDVEGAKGEIGTNVWQYSQNFTDAQKWELINCYDDVFEIKTKLGDFYLDVAGANSENGTNIRIWESNHTNAQRFKFKKIDINDIGLLIDPQNSEFVPDYAKRFLRLRDYFFEYYTSKPYKNILVLGDDNFLKSFNEIFKNCDKFKFNLKESIENVKNKEEYDYVINEKYKENFLKCIFSNTEIETFRQIYPPVLYQATINHLKKNGIPIYFFDAPRDYEMKNIDLIRQNHRTIYVDEFNFYKNEDYLNEIFGDNSSCKNYFTSMEFNKSCQLIKVKNHFAIADFKGKYCNIIDHHRFVKNAPEKHRNTIYMYGPCTTRSKYVSDDYTIEKTMQEYLNKDFPGLYNCIGYGVETDEINDFEYILDTEFKPGDIVIEERAFSDLLNKIINKNNCNYKSLSPAFDDPKIGRFSLDYTLTHVNHKGCKIIADSFYKEIKSKLMDFSKCEFEDKVITFGDSESDDQFIKDNPDFVPYLDKLKVISKPYIDAGKKIGSLNVNCNPFTKGHRYLIEESLKKVDHLFLFVVEEDASEFSFKDRYEMVKRGIADLDNITLLTTGKWMCSKFTFPDYFDKDALQSKVILNPTKDIELYGRYIAPALGATMRFAGEEPFDLITRQHNNFMKEKLPLYGIKFCEIPRKTLDDGQIISASKARKYLKEKNFNELEKLVPKSTFDYLLAKFD